MHNNLRSEAEASVLRASAMPQTSLHEPNSTWPVKSRHDMLSIAHAHWHRRKSGSDVLVRHADPTRLFKRVYNAHAATNH